MGMRAAISNAVGAAFTAVGDIAESVTYRRTASAYNPATGTNTVTNTDKTVSAIFTRYSQIELARSTGINVTDLKMTVRTSTLALVPNIATDKVVRSSKTFNIIDYSSDPAGATYTLQLRAP